MSPFEYLLKVLDDFQLLKIFPVIYIILLILSKIIFKKFFNGLFLLIFTSAIVFSVMLDFYLSNEINNSKLIYFIATEGIFFFITLMIYKNIITKVNKDKLLNILKQINGKYFIYIVLWLFIGNLINLMNVSWDGSSRISFQTARWFSIVRLFSQLIDPVTGLLVIYNLYEKKIRKLLILSFLIVMLSATAGSKSGFVFFFLQYFFIYADLINVKKKLSSKLIVPLVTLMISAAALNFYFLGVDFDKIFERTVHYAEATIMVFPSDNPCAACEKQSMIALVHRGVGRLINDPSSLSLDNLFGYALSAEFYGENSMTGPNARIGAYSICAFPGSKIIIVYLIFIIFIIFNYFMLKVTSKRSNFLYLSSILLVFHGIQHFILDYNTAMSDLTLIVFILLFIFCQSAMQIEKRRM